MAYLEGAMIGQQILDITNLSAGEAVREFFAPLRALVRWVHAFLRMPVIISSASRLRMVASEEKWALSEIREIERSLDLVLRDRLRTVTIEIAALREQQLRDLRLIVRGLERSARSTAQAEAERAVVRYLSLADDFWRRGELSRADRVLRLLNHLGEHRQLDLRSYVWFNIGELLFEQNKLSRAEEYFARIVGRGEVEEVVAAAYARLALLHYHKGQFQETTDYASKALRFFERSEDKDALLQSYVQLASALIKQGSSEQTEEALAKATEASSQIRRFLLPGSR